MGLYIICGIFLSVLASLYTLPALVRSDSHLPGDFTGSIAPPLSVMPGRLRGRAALLVQIAVIIVLVFAAGTVRVESFMDTLFTRFSDAGRSVSHFTDQYGAVESLEVAIDTGLQYGLIDPEEYRKSASLEDSIRNLPGVSRVIGPDLIISHAFGRLLGREVPVRPATMEDIGETVELLRSSPDPGLFSELISPDYRSSRLLVWLRSESGPGPRNRNSRSKTIEAIEQIVAHTDIDSVQTGGAALNRYNENNEMTRQFILSIAFFLPAIILFLLLTERSLKIALIAVLPVAAGIIVYLGIAGLFNVPLRIMSGVGIAFVLGVGVDDAIYILRTSGGGLLPGHAFRAVTETTLLVVVGVLVTLLTEFRAVHETGLLISAGLIAATGTSLVWVPFLARHRNRKES